MNKNQNANVPGNEDKSKSGINRREMVRRLMLAGGAGFALPAIAEAYPDARNAAGGDSVANTKSKLSGSGWAPAFFDPHQSDTVAVLAERIIPGSSKAQVNRFIDLLLSVDTQEPQKKFLASLSAFEAESLRRYARPYMDLTETQQDKILSIASTAEPGHAAEGEPEKLTIRDHFENIKGWVSGAYFSSEIGMKELGWDGQYYFTSFPGCQESPKSLS